MTIMIVRHLRVFVLAATFGVLVWSVTAGSAVASAATRLRSGTVHTQLASHVTAGANTVPASLGLKGTGVMAAVVGVLALFALAFVIVTLIRRRVTAS
jgi:hypothetical protein